MDHAQCAITVVLRIHQQANGPHVVNLGKRDALAAHLFPDAEDVFRPAFKTRHDVDEAKLAVEFTNHPANVFITIYTAFIEQAGNPFVGKRFHVAEREVLKFPLEVADPQPMSERRVDLTDLPRQPQTPVRLGVRSLPDRTGPLGELDERNANVINQRHQHPSRLLQLILPFTEDRLVLAKLDIADGGHLEDTFNEVADILAELLAHVAQGQLVLSHGAINDGSNQTIFIHMQVTQDVCHLQPHAETRVISNPGRTGSQCLVFSLFREFTHLANAGQVDVRVALAELGQPQLEVNAIFVKRRQFWLDLNHCRPASAAPTTPCALCGETYR